MTFSELNNGDIFFVPPAKDTLWMKVGGAYACRVFKQWEQLKVSVAPEKEVLFDPQSGEQVKKV